MVAGYKGGLSYSTEPPSRPIISTTEVMEVPTGCVLRTRDWGDDPWAVTFVPGVTAADFGIEKE